jgi:FkbM family methyltransferase
VRKQVKGIWLPEAEEHLIPFIENGPEFAGAGTYQLHKLQATFPYIKNFRHAVDVGAHVGLWSRILARCFRRLTAFEPIEAYRTCFQMNVPAGQGCDLELQPVALARTEEVLRFDILPESSGATHVKPDEASGGLQVLAQTLDSFALSPVDFLKIDCEGYECFVVEGAEEMIRRERPCILVEQKPGKGSMYSRGDRDAVTLLQSWGAELKFEIAGDFCLVWP